MDNQIKKEKNRTGFTLMGPKGCDRNKASGRTETYKNAFTLIELIVVMAIIGILVLLATPKFLGYTERARETKHIHTAKVIESALEAYLINGGVFPDDLEVVDATLLEEAANKETLIGVGGYVTSVDEEVYYELTYDFIQKLDVKLSTKNALLIEANASSVPTAVYASEKGITLVDKEKTMKGYELQPGELPNEINPVEMKQISAGRLHTLVLMKSGQIWAWGTNTYGQLGRGNTISQNNPVLIPNLENVKHIYTGDGSSFAIMEDGTVKAWGENEYGQLGLGHTSNQLSPQTIPNLNNVHSLAVGFKSVVALISDGMVKSWGWNANGQLGLGHNDSVYSPTSIPDLSKVKSISSGAYHVFAIMQDDTVMAWGYGGFGALGIGDGTSSNVPILNPYLADVKAIYSGEVHNFAIKKNGTVLAWGRNELGQLGLGHNTRSVYIPTHVAALDNSKSIVLGANHSMAILSDGTVKVWGNNNYGELGLGNTTKLNIPTVNNSLNGVSSLYSGHHFSLAIKNSNVLSWGDNRMNQLGQGHANITYTPRIVVYSNGTPFVMD